MKVAVLLLGLIFGAVLADTADSKLADSKVRSAVAPNGGNDERLQQQRRKELLAAAQQGHVEDVAKLIELGVTGKEAGPDGSYPVQWAAAAAAADATQTVKLVQILLDAVELKDKQHSDQRVKIRAAIVALAELSSSLGELDKFEVGQRAPEGVVKVVEMIAPSAPAPVISNLLASVACASGLKMAKLLVARCRIDDADRMLTLLPCVADSASDPTPLPTKLAALMDLVATKRFHGKEDEARAAAGSVLRLSEELANALDAGELNATDSKEAGALTMRARALLAAHAYEDAFHVYRRLSHSVPRRLSSGRVMLPTEVSTPIVMTAFQLEHDVEQVRHLHASGKLRGGEAALRQIEQVSLGNTQRLRTLTSVTPAAVLSAC